MQLPVAELWLLDWITSSQGETISVQKRDELMRWRDLRERIWRGLLLAHVAAEAQAPIELQEAECEELLAIVPTTFRWGTGEDVGLALKMRLADELWGHEERERHASLAKVRAMLKEGTDAASSSHQPDQDHAQDFAADPA